MTSSRTSAPPDTALALLVGADAPDVDVGRLWDGPAGTSVATALSRIEPVLRAAARLEITKAATELLQLDLVGMLVDGWRKYEDLLAVARRSLETPERTELVELASHRVTAGEHPYIDLVVDGTTVFTIRLELTVVFDVTVLAVSVRAARIVALHSGRTEITATLTVDGAEAPVGHEVVDLPLTVELDDGIELLPSSQTGWAGRSDDVE